MLKIKDDPKVQESFSRFSAEISNRTFALAYIAVKDCIDQKEYCKRIGISETRFSRVLSKLEKESSAKTPVVTA